MSPVTMNFELEADKKWLYLKIDATPTSYLLSYTYPFVMVNLPDRTAKGTENGALECL